MNYQTEERWVLIGNKPFRAIFIDNHSRIEAIVDQIRDYSKDDVADFREVIYVKW